MTDEEIIKWANEGKERDAGYLIVVFDRKLQEEFPVFIYKDSNVIEEIKNIFNCWYLQMVGIIDLNIDIHRQAQNLYSLNGDVLRN